MCKTTWTRTRCVWNCFKIPRNQCASSTFWIRMLQLAQEDGVCDVMWESSIVVYVSILLCNLVLNLWLCKSTLCIGTYKEYVCGELMICRASIYSPFFLLTAGMIWDWTSGMVLVWCRLMMVRRRCTPLLMPHTALLVLSNYVCTSSPPCSFRRPKPTPNRWNCCIAWFSSSCIFGVMGCVGNILLNVHVKSMIHESA